MNDVNDTFAKTVKDRLKELDLKTFAAEKRSGLAPDAIRSVLRPERKVGPTLKRAFEICDALGLELYIGPPRQDRLSDPVDPSDVSFVKRFDVQLSAGPGTDGDNAPELAPLAFRKKWLQDEGLVASSCFVVSVRSDSMEPGLHQDDLVLVDTRRTTIRDGKIYAIVDVSGDVRVKRLDQIGSDLVLRSDNPSYPAEIRKPKDLKVEGFRIIGQIVWSGHIWPK